ncbi:hypothetical protein PENPOL_c044G09999 [Penicillium polonicum]|uniref:Uncharacterized protein n=1 Tax=Penicillium polonicum TaxID=60169 RepID=A0A1V6N5K1_PENPO|nr:hypothetical protein PENPOL_c044G09999 [Penicillium polonicum]
MSPTNLQSSRPSMTRPANASTASPSRKTKRRRLVQSDTEDEVLCLGTELPLKPTSSAPPSPPPPQSPGVSVEDEVTFVESKPLSASAKYAAACSEAMHQGKVSQDWHEIQPNVAPPPMPPIIRHTLLNDAAFATPKACYARYKETLAALARLEYERDKLTARLWQFNTERIEESTDEQPEA